MADQDWFSQNAPTQVTPQGGDGDWFAQNAPPTTAVRSGGASGPTVPVFGKPSPFMEAGGIPGEVPGQNTSVASPPTPQGLQRTWADKLAIPTDAANPAGPGQMFGGAQTLGRVLSTPITGARDVVNGAIQAVSPFDVTPQTQASASPWRMATPRQQLQGANKAVRGAMDVGSLALPEAMGVAPVRTGVSLGAGYLGSKLGGWLGGMTGDPDIQESGSLLGGIGAGATTAAMLPTPQQWASRQANKGAQKETLNSLGYAKKALNPPSQAQDFKDVMSRAIPEIKARASADLMPQGGENEYQTLGRFIRAADTTRKSLWQDNEQYLMNPATGRGATVPSQDILSDIRLSTNPYMELADPAEVARLQDRANRLYSNPDGSSRAIPIQEIRDNLTAVNNLRAGFYKQAPSGQQAAVMSKATDAMLEAEAQSLRDKLYTTIGNGDPTIPREVMARYGAAKEFGDYAKLQLNNTLEPNDLASKVSGRMASFMGRAMVQPALGEWRGSIANFASAGGQLLPQPKAGSLLQSAFDNWKAPYKPINFSVPPTPPGGPLATQPPPTGWTPGQPPPQGRGWQMTGVSSLPPGMPHYDYDVDPHTGITTPYPALAPSFQQLAGASGGTTPPIATPPPNPRRKTEAPTPQDLAGALDSLLARKRQAAMPQFEEQAPAPQPQLGTPQDIGNAMQNTVGRYPPIPVAPTNSANDLVGAVQGIAQRKAAPTRPYNNTNELTDAAQRIVARHNASAPTDAIEAAYNRLAGAANGEVDFTQLRQALQGMAPHDFDNGILELARQGRFSLQQVDPTNEYNLHSIGVDPADLVKSERIFHNRAVGSTQGPQVDTRHFGSMWRNPQGLPTMPPTDITNPRPPYAGLPKFAEGATIAGPAPTPPATPDSPQQQIEQRYLGARARLDRTFDGMAKNNKIAGYGVPAGVLTDAQSSQYNTQAAKLEQQKAAELAGLPPGMPTELPGAPPRSMPRMPRPAKHPRPARPDRPDQPDQPAAIAAMAAGGQVAQGPLQALVGEAGPELDIRPDGSQELIQQPQVRTLGMGGTEHIIPLTRPEGQPEVLRGSSSVGLAPDGIAHAQALAKEYAGGLDRIYSSPLNRAMQTATPLAQANPQAQLVPHAGLQDMGLGQLEGQPVTHPAIEKINGAILNNPDMPMQGQGPNSTAPGDSFNSFKERALGFTTKLMHEHMQAPHSKVGAVTHSRVIRTIQGWANKGFPADHSIDHKPLTDYASKSADPGGVMHLAPNHVGQWQLKPHTGAPKKPGIYLIRHGRTPDNGAVATPHGNVSQFAEGGEVRG